jgi:hypothetical protein
MTEYSFIIPKYTDELGQTLTNLYEIGGDAYVFDYVKEHHKDWDWDYCEPCDCDTPIYKYDGNRICAVCFSDFDFNNNNQ